MLENQKSEFFDLMCATAEVYGQPKLSKDAIRIWWASLQRFDIADVRQALDEHIRQSKFVPRPADILDIIDRIKPDGRPNADEAWAMIPRDEYTSAVMTQEMAEALHIAQPLLDEGDQVAARMAFKESYGRIVDQNKRNGVKPSWFASLGQDKEGRESVLAEAVRLGRIEANHAIKLLPPENAYPMLQCAGEDKLALEYKPPSKDEIKSRLAAMKESLKVKTV